jgi:hypothetical protein
MHLSSHEECSVLHLSALALVDDSPWLRQERMKVMTYDSFFPHLHRRYQCTACHSGTHHALAQFPYSISIYTLMKTMNTYLTLVI